MQIKHSAMVALLDKQADRFHTYTKARSLSERLDLLQQVPACDGIEVVYPGEFRDVEAGVKAIKASGWPISALNLNLKGDAHWRNGSFTSIDPAIRARAVVSDR